VHFTVDFGCLPRKLPRLKILNIKPSGFCHRTCLGLLAFVKIAGASDVPANVAFQYHCAGSSALAGDPHLVTLQKVLALPWTTNLENLARIRFCGLLTNSLRQSKIDLTASLMEPLLGDVVETESLGQFHGASVNGPSFILALRLGAERAKLWQENAGKILGGNGEKFMSGQFSGRRWNAGGSNSFWIIPARDWVLAGCGDDFSPLQVEYLSQIRAQGRPVPALDHNWLEAEIDSTRVGGWFRRLKPASIRITVAPEEDNLQIEAKIVEAEAIPWQSDPWQIPKELMRGQVISFTAGQNVAAFLDVDPALSRLDGSPLTNQFYFWALDQVPLLNFMVWPVTDASNTLQRLAAEAPAAMNPELKRFNGTELSWFPEARKLVCRNMRLFVPVLEAVQDKDGQFLFLSSFPWSSKGKPAPDALLGQIRGRTNLVYYDWELTGRRLMEWQILRGMIANRSRAQKSEGEDTTLIENDWLAGVETLAGNTVTEITHVAPNELLATRKAPIGLTSLELALLADWICDANSGPIHSAPPVGKTPPIPGHP
jgi:hypothetical protein